MRLTLLVSGNFIPTDVPSYLQTGVQFRVYFSKGRHGARMTLKASAAAAIQVSVRDPI